ncbi:MerR family transcriptional regulator [Clostridium sporogenes]|uniref:MerR family transcriptional regulator n=1 Tax=Clostridium botulinum TaxID=1491 RepID=A0A6M0T0D8_CLOBO|nr:MerR family transcriptional regulator [Clostridium sporogenes]NFA61239.1 MerR family transcriptional regulator [Clostridium botulinum]NFI72053.1 MerR family transcriptional regulator [Clostridium sporogenes]NFL72768.1 MerR family transcriptional regulator [Clostridium sporogenes]NFM24424.1 MerR family transcriptional regulator [Clostridium sporogenes]NFP61099.1 MerR family transcriptional regulator [Clostridium sporogenes]
MKIKEAELLTGLSQNTIRYYESEGLISVKRNLNSYREYDEGNISKLKKIKILRKLDVSIATIKKLNLKKISLQDILNGKIKEIDEKELNLECKKGIIESILKEINKNPNVDLAKYCKDFEYIESDEFTETLDELRELGEISLAHQILITLMLSGPFLWLFINIKNSNYEFIGINSIASIVSTVLLTLLWKSFLKQKNKKVKGTGLILLNIVFAIVLSIGIFVFISKLQQFIFVPKDYLMFKFKPPYSYFIFFFEIEIIIVFIFMIYRKIKNIELKWSECLFKFLKKNIFLTISLNIALMYICVTSVIVVTKDQIKDYNFYNPKGTIYSYNDIYKVQAGFKGKRFKISKGHAGDFYYIINLRDGKKINLYQANSPFEDTYLELEIFDNLIMRISKIQKASSKENYQFCDFDKRYIDRFLRIIENR